MDALCLIQTGLLGIRRLRNPPTHYQIRTVGYLDTQQWEPLPHAGLLLPSPFKINDLLRGMDPLDFSFPDFMSIYFAKNFTTKFTPIQSFFDSRYDPAEERRITASVYVKYPVEIAIHYWTGAFEMFKWAWVQYMAAFLPLYVVLGWLRGVLFRNGVFAQVVVDDGPKSDRVGSKERPSFGFPTVMG
jgi:hypothetical protein